MMFSRHINCPSVQLYSKLQAVISEANDISYFVLGNYVSTLHLNSFELQPLKIKSSTDLRLCLYN